MRVGVLRGGPGSEYEVSLRTGRGVLENLPQAKYEPRDILIDKNGAWHLDGLPTAPARAARAVDVFFNALHGEFGEDGQVQMILDRLAVPYTGSGTIASAIGMNKQQTKEVLRRQGLRVPPGIVADRSTEAMTIFRQVSPPWVVKPVAGGSSVGVFFARTLPELVQALSSARALADTLLVEHYLRGREATAGVVDNLRGREVYALPPIEIRRQGGKPIWTYDDKYSGETEEICPGDFDQAVKGQIENWSVAAHRALGLRHYSRSDFIITAHGLYILETNSLPGLTAESLLPKALAAVGCSYADFLDHVINLALTK